MSKIYAEYRKHCAERLSHGLPPLALNRNQVEAAIASLNGTDCFPARDAVDLLRLRVRPGIDPGAALKAKFLWEVASGACQSDLLDRKEAVRWLGLMVSGYAVDYLVDLLTDEKVCEKAVFSLGKLVHIYDQFETVQQFADDGVESARELMELWACESWLVATPIPEQMVVRLLRAEGETTTDDLSPAGDVSTRVDVPLHAQAMLKFGKGSVIPDKYGVTGPMKLLDELKGSGSQLAFCGDIVGTGSSRASATNSLMWHFGVDLLGYPNRRTRAVCIARQFAPIFLNTQRDYGALPVLADVDGLRTGQDLVLHTHDGIMTSAGMRDRTFSFGSSQTLLEARAGGRINLVLGRQLTNRARRYLALGSANTTAPLASCSSMAYTQAKKIVGRATGRAGVSPGEYCEPKISTIALPDDAGPSTADELSDLGCRRFGSDFVLQSFCHTAAYPNSRDIAVQKWLPGAITERGGVVLRPGDGIIHSWLNKVLVPDQMGTGADSHTRFPLGLSFPAASNLVAFAAATGSLPLVMPESVLVRFVGKLKTHLTVRDMVHAIPMVAQELGLINLSKTERRNVFSGRPIEVEGLEWLSVENAFEICDATAERGAVGTTIALAAERVVEHVRVACR
ncbi:aconitase family protein [Cupriavidus oxalaticus]|uniref:aconitase family protein n=1 Tax=Cupriavidus oxalaticus TaxID=96344 RepID=UPI0040344C23